MKNIDDILKEVECEAILLTEEDDCFSVELGNEKGLFVQVIDNGEGLEYFIELNDIVNGGYEPCAKYNSFSEFSDIEQLKVTIVNYLIDNELIK